jgi:glutamate synthase (NADPH/NADH) large chain
MDMVMLDLIDADDEALIQNMIIRHQQFTRSKTANDILTDWSASVAHFVKVMPVEYKEVLRKRTAEKSKLVKA